jgi:hypothetical protein
MQQIRRLANEDALPCGQETAPVTIYRLLEDHAFDPEAVAVMTTAYEDACHALNLADKRSDPITQVLAQKIIEIAKTGMRDAAEISKTVLKEMHLPPA